MPKTSVKREATINFRLGNSLKGDVERYAAARDMTVAEFVRYVLWAYMNTTPVSDDEE